MGANATVGYSLLFLGVVILLFALYLGYGIYKNIDAGVSYSTNAVPQSAGPGAGTTVSAGATNTSTVTSLLSALGVLGSVTSELKGMVMLGQNDALIGIEIVVLYLFASIGYKISMIGISTIRMSGEEKEGGKREKEKEKDKG